MDRVNGDSRTKARLPDQEEDLRRRLEEAEQTLEAIRRGEVDAIVVAGPHGDQVYSLTGVEHAYRVIVETMNEAALTTDLGGTILFCNQRFCDLMRTPMHEVLGRNVSDFAAEPQQPVLKTIMTQAQAEPVREHLTLRAADGTAVPVLLSASFLRTADNVSLCLVASDLTELEESANSILVLRESRQALQESEERYRRFFMDDLTGDFIATPDGAIVECNPAFVVIYGFESPEQAVVEGDVSRFNPQDWRRLVAEVRRQGRVRRYEGRHACPDGRAIYVIANVTGRFNDAGELVGLHGYIFEDTERKLAEMALQETNARLEAQHENLLAANEQLLTQQEELHRQALELAHANVMQTELKEQAEHAAAQREWLARVPRESPNPVFRIAPDFRILYHNSAAGELCPLWKCEEGMPPAVRELISAALGKRATVSQELSLGWYTYLLDVAPFAADGYVNLYVQDITDRKQAEEDLRESEERFRTMADGSPLIIWVTDRDGRMQFVNRAYREFFGVTLEQVQSGGWQPLVHPEDASTYTEPFMQCLRAHRPFHAKGRVRRHDGQWRWIESYGEPRFSVSGEFLGIAGSSPDITEQRQAEDSLRELTQTLETRVAQRTRELEYRARQLQKLALELSQAEEQERRRLAEILHDDLQQQLAAVKFHLGILGSRTKDDFGVQKSVGQLDKMLKDAIDTSRSLSHELSPAVMYHGDMGEIFEWLANQIRTKHGLLVEVDARGRVDVESDALKTFLYKAVQEMLFNAVKHAKVSRARVRVRRRGQCICVCVSDYGRGFDPQELKKTAGFGLMSIRERVELLGGRMKIHSVKGAGSRFIVTVPDGAMMEGRGRKAEASGPASADCILRVLIADDHEIVRHGLAALLSEEKDIELVGEAGNGREAVDLAYQLRPDVVILDVAMPLINGDEAARQIRRHLPGTRIVALSMYGEAGTAEKMRRAGAEAYLLKTAPADELLEAVRGRK